MIIIISVHVNVLTDILEISSTLIFVITLNYYILAYCTFKFCRHSSTSQWKTVKSKTLVMFKSLKPATWLARSRKETPKKQTCHMIITNRNQTNNHNKQETDHRCTQEQKLSTSSRLTADRPHSEHAQAGETQFTCASVEHRSMTSPGDHLWRHSWDEWRQKKKQQQRQPQSLLGVMSSDCQQLAWC